MIEFTAPIHKTKILPLRWFANMCNHWSSPFLATAVDAHYMNMDFDVPIGFRYKFNIFMYQIIDKPYKLWGTTYEVDMEKWLEHIKDDPLLEKLVSDYDENGVPYWDYDWHEDPITGDAWRLIKK